MTTLLLLLLPALAWAQGPDQVSTPPIVFDSAAVTSCTGRKVVSGSVSYCDNSGVMQAVSGSASVRCGDNVINQASEQCDGTALPTGCVSCGVAGGTNACQCVRAPTCGNGVIEAGAGFTSNEMCDTGASPSGCTGTTACVTCTSCVETTPPCGDSTASGGACPVADCCDPPMALSTCSAGYVCNPSCAACVQCGNGVLDAGEDCDPGDYWSGDNDPPPVHGACVGACNALDCSCPTATCGDGIFSQGSEACDASATQEEAIALMDCPPGECTGTCLCDCGPVGTGGRGSCGDGTIDTSCIALEDGSGNPGGDEECELTTVSASSWGNMFNTRGTSKAVYSSWLPVATFDTEPFTVEAWIYPINPIPGGTSYQQIAGNGGGSTASPGWSLLIQNSTGLLELATASGSDADSCVASTPLTANTWHHIAVTRTTTSCQWWIAVGTATTHTAQTETGDGVETTLGTPVTPFRVGAANTLYAFNGYIDDLRIWNTARSESELNTNFLAPISCATADLYASWQFDETPSSATTTDCDSNAYVLTYTVHGSCTSDCWSIDSSTAPGTGGTAEEYSGCGSGETCDTTTCQCGSGEPDLNTLWISPTGSDSNDGRTSSTPKRTFASLQPLVVPGTTITVMDGTYTPPAGDVAWAQVTCGTSSTQCAGGSYWPCGTATAPITIKAQNQRKALIDANPTDGSWNAAIRIYGCQYWVVDGVAARGGDVADCNTDSLIQGGYSDNITVQNALVWRNNRYDNTHLISLDFSTNVAMIANEGYRYHRHCMSAYGSTGVRYARNYCGQAVEPPWTGAADLAGATDSSCATRMAASPPQPYRSELTTRGQSAASHYSNNTGVTENNIWEDGLGMTNPATGGRGLNHTVAGNIALTYGGALVGSVSRESAASGRTFINNLGITAQTYMSPGVLNANNTLKIGNNTLWGSYNDAVLNLYRGGWNWGACSGCTGTGCVNLNDTATPCTAWLSNNVLANSTSGYGINQSSDIGTWDACDAQNNCSTGNSAGTASSNFLAQCTGTEFLASCATLTGYGATGGSSLVYVPSGATSIYGTGYASQTFGSKICHGGTQAQKRCTTDDTDATTGCPGATCPGCCTFDVGANIICRYENATLTADVLCTGDGAPWSCCTGSGTGHCEVWARDTQDCGGAACVDKGTTNCTASDVTAAGMPNCKFHFTGCGAVIDAWGAIESPNDVDDESCFDLHERAGIAFGGANHTTDPPACP